MDTNNPNPEDHKPTFEERMQALMLSLELLSVNVHEMQERAAKFEAAQERFQEEQKRLDARERKARAALLTGVTAYLRAINDNGEEAQ